MAMSEKEASERIQKVSRSFQDSLNKRLDKMTFNDVDGDTYDEMTHFSKCVYFVQRDENTIELWKGDTQISGQGGDWVVVNALLLESPTVTQITGGANGSIFMTAGTGDDGTTINTPTYGQRTGQFTLTTRGRQEGQNWVTQNAPTGDFNILYNYQLAKYSNRSNPYSSFGEDQTTKYPIYILNIIRGNVRETITFKVFQIECHTSWMPQSVPPYISFPLYGTYDETYQYAYNNSCVVFRTGIYVTRSVENGETTHGYYHANGISTKGVKNILGLTVTNIHYDSNLNAVVGTPYMYQEFSKQQSCCGQLGIRRDLVTGLELSEPLVIFNVNHPQNYMNEFIMYKILKGESIT